MEYNWSIEKFEHQKRQIRMYLKLSECLTKEERTILKDMIKEIDLLEQDLVPKKRMFPITTREKYFDKTSFLPMPTYQEYQTISNEVKKQALKTIDSCRELFEPLEESKLKKLKITDEELVEMSHDFYKTLPNKKYLKQYEFYTNPDKHFLRFSLEKSVTHRGLTTFIYYPRYSPYILVEREKTVDDFITLNHEIAHAIFYRNEKKNLELEEHYYLSELEGSFFDFLSHNYLKNILAERDIKILEYGNLISEYNNAIDFYLINMAMKFVIRSKSLSVIPFQKKLMEEGFEQSIDEDILLTSLAQNPRECIKYTISYLTRLDLEKMYEKDPEYAFYLLERIRGNKTDKIFENLRENEITFMDDGQQNLMDKVKKIGTIND